MLNLTRTLAEYETDVAHIWEEPDQYSELMTGRYCLVSGRKGAGKSTLVDYAWSVQSPENLIVRVRPQIDKIYARMYDLLLKSPAETDPSHSLGNLLEFLCYLKLFREATERFLDDVQNDHDLRSVRTFLDAHYLQTGPITDKALNLAASLTADFRDLHHLLIKLQQTQKPAPTFAAACEAFRSYLRRKKRTAIVFIDDLDAIGFKYDTSHKIFVKAVIEEAMRLSTSPEIQGALRVIATPPTELLNALPLWNRDKVPGMTITLRWQNLEKLERLVSKRIAIELKTKKREPRFEGDRYSVDSIRTWMRVFPEKLWNRIGAEEPTLQYIARHTLYTPRNILGICQAVLKELQRRKYTLETLREISTEEWSSVIQIACEEGSLNISMHVRDMFESIYVGIADVFGLFRNRPNIWPRREFDAFLSQFTRESVLDEDGKRFLDAMSVARVLYEVGFLGYAFEERSRPIGGGGVYTLNFSYVRWSQRARANLAVISPVFYDFCGVEPIEKAVVVPHSEVLRINKEQMPTVLEYSFEKQGA